VLNGGGISYLGITNADVKANWPGWADGNATTNIAYLGNNFFRLNSASNTTAFDQSYTFDTGLGASNFAGLFLMGNSAYRGGTFAIGPYGSFTVLMIALPLRITTLKSVTSVFSAACFLRSIAIFA
jgi:hypothetical protein